MFKILEKKDLNESGVYMKVEAPLVAAKAKPGQFVIIRAIETSERVPLTIAEYNAAEGAVSVIFQAVGASTMDIASLEAGEYLLDFAGPLGRPSELDGYKRAAVIGGGLGCAIAYPQAKYLHEHGCAVDIIAGFRNESLIILEDEMRACGDKTVIVTDDGSNGNKGLVTDALKAEIEGGAGYDLVIAIGPPIMMKFVCALTAEYGIKTIVSMNPIMIDGTGMCGGCRLTVDGKTRFACVDGPDFDGHQVDFDELIRRNNMYRDDESHMREAHCNLLKH